MSAPSIDSTGTDTTLSPPPYEEPRPKNDDQDSTNHKPDDAHKQRPKKIRKSSSIYDLLKPAEIRNPKLVLCSACESFHDRPWPPYTFKVNDQNCAANTQWIRLGGELNLFWWRAHMVMRAVRLLPGHGLELKDIYSDLSWTEGKWQLFIEPKVTIQQHLLLKVTAQRILDLTLIWRGIKLMPGCRHLQKNEDFADAVKQAILTFTAAGAQHGHQSPVLRCAWCPTEVTVSVHLAATTYGGESHLGELVENDYRLTVVGYTDVGPCDSTFSREWYLLSLSLLSASMLMNWSRTSLSTRRGTLKKLATAATRGTFLKELPLKTHFDTTLETGEKTAAKTTSETDRCRVQVIR